MEPNNNHFEIKAYGIGELSRIYEVSYKTMSRWLKPHMETIGKREGRYFTSLQVGTIV